MKLYNLAMDPSPELGNPPLNYSALTMIVSCQSQNKSAELTNFPYEPETEAIDHLMIADIENILKTFITERVSNKHHDVWFILHPLSML